MHASILREQNQHNQKRQHSYNAITNQKQIFNTKTQTKTNKNLRVLQQGSKSKFEELRGVNL